MFSKALEAFSWGKSCEAGCAREVVRTALRILVHLNVSFAVSFLFICVPTLGFTALSLECSCPGYSSVHKSLRQMALPQCLQALSDLIFVPCSSNTISKLQTLRQEVKVNTVSSVSNKESSVVWLPGIWLDSHLGFGAQKMGERGHLWRSFGSSLCLPMALTQRDR